MANLHETIIVQNKVCVYIYPQALSQLFIKF